MAASPAGVADLNSNSADGAAKRRGRTTIDEPERDLWQGSYSARAMLGVWVILGVLTLAAIVVGALQVSVAWQWGILLGVVGLGWIVGALVWIYRRLGIHYRLTTQRLFIERGLLKRTIDRIELIRINDITCEQGIFERMLGIGSIHIRSTDQTEPDFWMLGVEKARDVTSELDQARRAEQVRRGALIGSAMRGEMQHDLPLDGGR